MEQEKKIKKIAVLGAPVEMIEVTGIKGEKFIINSDKILIVHQQADTIITMMNGLVYRVQETKDSIIEKMIDFRRKIVIV